jgi:hypothetical protein
LLGGGSKTPLGFPARGLGGSGGFLTAARHGVFPCYIKTRILIDGLFLHKKLSY